LSPLRFCCQHRQSQALIGAAATAGGYVLFTKYVTDNLRYEDIQRNLRREGTAKGLLSCDKVVVRSFKINCWEIHWIGDLLGSTQMSCFLIRHVPSNSFCRPSRYTCLLEAGKICHNWRRANLCEVQLGLFACSFVCLFEFLFVWCCQSVSAVGSSVLNLKQNSFYYSTRQSKCWLWLTLYPIALLRDLVHGHCDKDNTNDGKIELDEQKNRQKLRVLLLAILICRDDINGYLVVRLGFAFTSKKNPLVGRPTTTTS